MNEVPTDYLLNKVPLLNEVPTDYLLITIVIGTIMFLWFGMAVSEMIIRAMRR